MTTYATTASIAIGVAAVSAGSLLGTPAQDSRFGEYRLLLAGLWLASLLAVAVAYAGPMIGAMLLPSGVPAVIDLLLPSLLGICEFTLFTALAYPITKWSSPRAVLVAWWISFMAFNLVALCCVYRAMRLVKTATWPAALDGIFRHYLARLRGDMKAAMVVFAFATVGATTAEGYILNGHGFARHLGLSSQLPINDNNLLANYTFAIGAILFLSGGLVGHRATAREVRNDLGTISEVHTSRTIERRHTRRLAMPRAMSRHRVPDHGIVNHSVTVQQLRNALQGILETDGQRPAHRLRPARVAPLRVVPQRQAQRRQDAGISADERNRSEE